ncbi:hypothetical protein C8N46_101671 [Kordia periserrulae]|uniref:Uncharacterized protein n=1 Tax=Kordia periserrulae TaxID=701523 RepID=A0A2T6C6V4_9FLAO|nr:hypothetical protein [Kordia periserrulae]PTX64061.1 hypothetical protein C8N46_101671 [Kordia periserrulae]
MNSYNENLHSSVVSSLNAQELELQKLKSQKDSATFSMYYAQGARITAAEKLQMTTSKYKFQQQVNNQAVSDSDMSTNVLTSANNVKTYVAKSVTNASVAAANVQIATNAIVKLASDTGSIFSIVNAADFGTEIYRQAEKAKQYMDQTAYLAERTSQSGMEASALVAKISANTLAEEATTADTSVKSLLSVTSAQLDATTTELATESQKLATSNTEEKKAEGTLEDINAVYHATQTAYDLTNKELNLGLGVVSIMGVSTADESEADVPVGDETHYTVQFSHFKTPFRNVVPPKPQTSQDGKTIQVYNPVENYYIMLAKTSKKDTFSISEADALVGKENSSQYIKIHQSEFVTVKDNVSDLGVITKKIFTSELEDTDGDAMILGNDYVIFVYAELRTNYKKIINTFDNYLSAASAKFTLQNQLSAPKSTDIIVTPNGLPSKTKNNTAAQADETQKQVVSFTVWEDKDYTVSYRCMFLPHNKSFIKDLLTVEGLNAIESEAEGLERIADFYDPKIASTSTEITSTEAEITGIDAQLKEANDELKSTQSKAKKKSTDAKEKAALEKQEKQLENSIAALLLEKEKLTTKLEELQNKLTQYETGRQTEIEDLESSKKHVKPGFYFDLLTAEQVPAGSYTTTSQAKGSHLNEITRQILTIIDDTEALKVDIQVLKNNANQFVKDCKTLIKDIASKKGLDTLKNDAEAILKDVENMTDSLNAAKKEFVTLINDIIKLVKDIKSEASLLQLFEELIIIAEGYVNILNGYACSRQEMIIEPETTDNFGNRLINTKMYIPAVLSISNNASVEENAQFTNALSDFQKTADFIYLAGNSANLNNYQNQQS